MRKTRIHILAVAVLCLSTISCSESFDTSFFDKEIEDPSIAVGLKIGYSEFTATELFEEIGDDIQVGTTDDNGKSVVSFKYTQSLSSSENSDFVSVDNQTFAGDFEIFEGLAFSIPDGGYTVGRDLPLFDDGLAGTSEEKTFINIQEFTKANGDPLDYELTSAEFNKGVFVIKLETTTDAQTEVFFTIPSLQRKNPNDPKYIVNPEYPNSYYRRFILNNNGEVSDDDIDDITEVEVELSDYDFDLTYDGLDPKTNDGVNKVAVKLDAIISFQNEDQISNTDKLTYTISLKGDPNNETLTPQVKSAYGDFKDAGFNINNQEFDLDFFEQLGEGNITFENPILKLTATSGYGFPVGLTLETISATDETVTNSLEITDASPLNDNIEPINGDTDNHYAIIDGAATNGDNVATTITLDSQNSNLADLLNDKPTKFNLNVTAGANPNSTTANTNFFDVDNTLNVDVEVELPLHVTFDGLTFSPDAFEFDADDISDLEENLNSLDLVLFTRNSIPLTGTISLQFLDTNGTRLFSKPASLMEAAPLDNDGFSSYTLSDDGILKQGTTVIEPTSTTVTLDADNISDLTNVTHIKAVIEFNTTNSSAAKIQSTDKVRLDIAVLGDFKFSGEDDNN